MMIRTTYYGRCADHDHDGPDHMRRYIGDACETLEDCAERGAITDIEVEARTECDCCGRNVAAWFIIDHGEGLELNCGACALSELIHFDGRIDTTGNYYTGPNAVEQITERI